MSELEKQQREVEPQMGVPIVVRAGTFSVETGISFGACVLAVVLLEEGVYQIFHIPPGSIVNELTSMLARSANQSVAVFQGEVRGVVDTLVLGGGTGTIYTGVQALKRAFRNRDRNARF